MIRLFKFVAVLEGLSLLLLLFFAMPMKYIWHEPFYVKTIGMAHGVLFVAYMIIAVVLKFTENWSWTKLGVVSLASLVPFGTFYIERKYFSRA